MLKHYLSVITLIGTASLSAYGGSPATAPPVRQLLQRDTAFVQQTTPPDLRGMEDSITNLIKGKEAMLGERYLTEFEEAPLKITPELKMLLPEMTLERGALRGAPVRHGMKAFTIPGDSLAMMAKDYSYNGSTYVAPVVVKQDGDSVAIYNLYNWGSQAGYRAPRAFVANDGTVTIPAQKVLTHATYGDIWIAPMTQQGTSIKYTFDPITGTMDAEGNIKVGGWGLFVPAGAHQNTLFNAFGSSEWKPCNAVFRSHNVSKDAMVTGNALIEQTGEGEIAIYNLSGGDYGEVLYARLNSNHTASVSPQKVFFNAMLGDFYCYPAEYSGTSAKVDLKGSITITETDTALNMAGWAITARGSSQYAAAFYDYTTIYTTFRPTWPVSHTPSFAGKGTQAEPYKLASANDFAVLAEKVNEGDAAFSYAYYELAGDIDWNGLSYAFSPIGSESTPFCGHLDGKGHTIKNFTYNGRGFYHSALFGFTGPGSDVSNLNMTDINVKGGGRYTSSLIAESWSKISNVHVAGSIVSTGECVGGIVSNSCAPITESSFTGGGTSGGTWGGIAGDAYAPITKCHTDVNIATVGYMNSMFRSLGGIAGTVMFASAVNLPVEVSDCYVTGTLADNLGYAYVGGITATLANGATMKRCFNTATISAKRLASQENDNATGGIVAWAREGEITDCYNAGTIVKSGTSDMTGGIIGYLSVGYISTSGQPTQMAYQTYVKRCYNSAQVVSSSTLPQKSIVGTTYYYQNFDPIAELISDCYSDAQISTHSGSPYDMTTAALTGSALPAGFSSDVWQATPGYYPTLRSIGDNAVTRLSSVALRLADGESSTKMKNTATLTTDQNITWKLYSDEGFVDSTDALAISGSSLSVKNRYSNSVVVAMLNSGSMRMYRLAVVPKLFEGDGTEQNPYLIRNVADFRQLNEAVGTFAQPHVGDYFRMTADVDFGLAMDFSGVGAGYTPAIGFGGTFDGDNHTIHNLRIAAAAFDADGKAITTGSYLYSGLFNNILATGTVRNLNIAADCDINHWSSGGAISGYNMGLIENCRNYAPQTSISDYVGGITGYNTGEVKRCYNAGEIVTGRTMAGGIAGANTSLIELCQNDGDVIGKVVNAYVSSASQNSVGGIVGGCATDARIISCLNQGNVTTYKQAGGISGMVTRCEMSGNINTGLVTALDETPNVGAFVGAVSTLSGENNYFDASVVICEAVASSGRPGFNALSTTALTAGNVPSAFPNAEEWVFAKNAYPVLKAFAAEERSKTLSTMYIGFGENETRANIQRSTPLSLPSAISWKLASASNPESGSLFSVADGYVNVTPAQGNQIGRDTLRAEAGNCIREYPVQTVPVIFTGAGTAQNPYQITSADDINRLSEFIYATGFDYADTYFKVMNDITFASTDTISPIAKGGSHQFNGVIDGNGKKISGYNYENITIVNTAAKPHPMGYPGRYIGFIAKLGSKGRVANLTLDGNFKVYSHLGGVVGDLYGSVDNCHVLGDLTTSNAGYVGGIASRIYAGGSVTNSSFGGKIVSKTTLNGGIAGFVYADGLIEGCVMKGSLSGTTTNGGIAGDLAGAVINCRVEKEATFNCSSSFGGIAYRVGANGRMEDCVNYANFTANATTATIAAGIVATTTASSNDVVVLRCVNYGNIESKSYTAGIAAKLTSGAHLKDCINYGTITSTGGSYTGGIVSNTATVSGAYTESVTGCVNYGEIHGFASYIGGISADVGTGVVMDSCINYGDIYTTATSSHLAVGGVVGVCRSIMTRCLNAGNVNTVGHGTGGVAGLVQSGEVRECANIGDVTSTGQFPASNPNGMAGGLTGYTVTGAKYYDCYSTGDITAPVNVCGLIGRVAAAASSADVPLENCYAFGKTTITGSSASPLSANLFVRNSGVNVLWSNIYYNSDVNPDTYSYDPGNRGRTEQQLQTVELGEAYTYSRAMLPRLNALVGIEAADIAAISLSFTKSGDTKSNINDIFYIGYPEKELVWELSPQFRMSVSDPGKVYPVELGAGTIKVCSPDGRFSRTFNLNVSTTTAVEEFGIDAAVPVSTEYFDMQGVRMLNPAPGTICIVRTVYSDGHTVTEKKMIR